MPPRNSHRILSATKAIVSRTLAAFSIPGFSRLWASSTLGIMGMMAGGLTLGWLVLDLTDSPFWVGATAAARGLGQVSFGVFAGVLIDRADRRRVLCLSQVLSGSLPLILGVLVLTGQIALWHILVARFLDGVFGSIRAPAFNTMAYQMAGPGRALNASAAMNLGFNLSSAVASAIAGALIAQWDVESGLLFSAACLFVSAVLVLFIQGKYAPAATPEPFLRAAAAGVRYSWGHLPVRRLLSLSLIIEVFGFSYIVMLPVVARDVLGVGASGLGLLSSTRGIGAALSTLAVASLGDFKDKRRLLVYSVISSGLFLTLFGLSRWYIVSLFLVMLASGSLSAYDVTMRTSILLAASDKVRGRVQSIYSLTYGGMSLGGFLTGSVATVIGAPYAISVSGCVILVIILRFLRPLMPVPALGDEVSHAAD